MDDTPELVGPEETIGTERLTLTPLRVEDADELAEVLGDPRLHELIGGRPDSVEELRRAGLAPPGPAAADRRPDPEAAPVTA